MQKEQANYDAFLSYARVDDETSSGTPGDVSKFHAALELEMRRLWNRNCRIFIDREIQSGQRWREVLEQRLNEVNFMIVMLSRSFFESKECRAEVEAFIAKATSQGLEARIFPILVQDVTYVEADDFYLELMDRQNSDYITLKYKGSSSEEFRLFVAEVANQIFNTLREKPKPAPMNLAELRNQLEILEGEKQDLLASLDEKAESLQSATLNENELKKLIADLEATSESLTAKMAGIQDDLADAKREAKDYRSLVHRGALTDISPLAASSASAQPRFSFGPSRLRAVNIGLLLSALLLGFVAGRVVPSNQTLRPPLSDPSVRVAEVGSSSDGKLKFTTTVIGDGQIRIEKPDGNSIELELSDRTSREFCLTELRKAANKFDLDGDSLIVALFGKMPEPKREMFTADAKKDHTKVVKGQGDRSQKTVEFDFKEFSGM